MTETPNRALTVVCLASFYKGDEFIRECKRQGCRVFLVTREKLLNDDWPRESLDDIIGVSNEAGPEVFINAVSQLGRHLKPDRIVALEEYDVITAGLIREHLCMPGLSSSTARVFRDKLSMRIRAREAHIPVPDFVHLLNYNEVGAYMNSVPPPWVLKPRGDVSAMGIKKIVDAEELWRAMHMLEARERLNERPSYYLLERFVAGDVYHVDSVVDQGRVVFAGANKYGRPPMEVAHQGGVFISHTIEHGSHEQAELFRLNQQLITSLGLERGASHAEFIKSSADGQFYFLEIAARVGGAYIAEALEAASGLNLWREWARIELAGGNGSYQPQPPRQEYGGIVLSLARQEYPDTNAYTEPEIVYRVKKRHHVGLVVRSTGPERVMELLDQYAARFVTDFCAVLPPMEKPE